MQQHAGRTQLACTSVETCVHNTYLKLVHNKEVLPLPAEHMKSQRLDAYLGKKDLSSHRKCRMHQTRGTSCLLHKGCRRCSRTHPSCRKYPGMVPLRRSESRASYRMVRHLHDSILMLRLFELEFVASTCTLYKHTAVYKCIKSCAALL